MHIFPVFALEQISEYEQEGQIEQNVGPDALMLQLYRVGRVGQEGHKVLDLLIELLFSQRAGVRQHCQLVACFMCQRRASERIILLLAIFYDLYLLAADNLTTLQRRQNVRHAHIREDFVVHSPRARRIFVERTKVAVQPVRTAHTRHQREVGRGSPKPGLGVLRLHTDVHMVANLGPCKHQIIEHDVMRDTQVISHPLIALELGTVTTHAVVGERSRAILQGRLVRHININLVELHTLLDKVDIDVSDKAALQDGARTFANYCMGCHSAKFQRYERVADDLGIPHEVMLDNLVFTGAKIGDHMKIGMQPNDAKAWFGAAPPDLTLVARVRGTDWLYSYLRAFYEDPSRPWGVNNKVFPNVGMPNVLAPLQGRQVIGCKQVQIVEDGKKQYDPLTGTPLTHEACDQLTVLPKTGALTEEQFDEKIKNLVTFLAYSANPVKLEHQRIGTYVLIYLAFLFVFAYLLKREYWKDVH